MLRRDFLAGTAATALLCGSAHALTRTQKSILLQSAKKPPIPNYFVSTSGSDSNNGHTPATAWQTVGKVNASTFNPGDTIAFAGGQTFTDAGLVPPSSGSPAGQITFTSYGIGRATINPGSIAVGLKIVNKSYITFDSINLLGTASTHVGLYLSATSGTFQNITLQNFTVSGFGDGFDIGGDAGSAGWSNVLAQNFTISGCSGPAGGSYGSAGSGVTVHSNITLQNGSFTTCLNGGWSMGNVNGGLIQNCVCFTCGASSTIGPAGLWCYESNSVVIRFCEAYNQLSANTVDGDGFDIDGGCTNCIVEYCYSHGNAGAAYALFNYGTLTWNNNTVRYCIGENSGRAGTFYGELTIEARNTVPCTGALVYNNTFYNNLNVSAIFCIPQDTGSTAHTGRVANNIFYSASNTPLIASAVNDSGLLFTGNDYFASGTFGISWNGTSYSSLAAWQTATGQEKIAGASFGFSVDPKLTSPGGGGTVGGYAPPNPTAYKLLAGSPMIGTGLDLNARFGINPGTQDYYGDALASPFAIGSYAGAGTGALQTINWVAEGNSITYGYAGMPAWPYAALSGMPGAPGTTPGVNAPTSATVTGLGAVNLIDGATSGISVITALDNYSTRAGTWYDATKNLNVLSVMLGTNTSGANDSSAMQKYWLLRAYLRAAETTGYQRKIVANMIGRDDDGGTTWTNVLVPLNTLINTYYNSDLRCDALLNFAADARFSPNTAADNTTYYAADKVHPSQTGEAVMGGLAEPTVLSVMQNPGTIVTIPTWSTIQGDNTGMTLSNGNRTVTGNAQILGFPATKGTKVYFEVACDTISGFTAIGIANEAWNVQGFIYNGTNSCAFASNGFWYFNGVNVSASATYGSGDILRICYDPSAELIWGSVIHSGVASTWNANALADPATGVGGNSCPGLGSGYVHPAVNPNGVITSRFSNAQLTGPIPSGYSAYAP